MSNAHQRRIRVRAIARYRKMITSFKERLELRPEQSPFLFDTVTRHLDLHEVPIIQFEPDPHSENISQFFKGLNTEVARVMGVPAIYLNQVRCAS